MTLKKIINFLFVAAILIVLTSGLVNTVFFPKEISEYENRYANKLDSLTWDSYMDGSFQNSMEEALGDQVDLASTYKMVFNEARSRILYKITQPLIRLDAFDDQYVKTRSGYIFDRDYLVKYPYDKSRTSELDEAVRLYNKLYRKQSHGL